MTAAADHDGDRNVLKAREWDDARLLHVAVSKIKKLVAAFLLSAGADVNAITKDGPTPSRMAAQNGSTDIMQLLSHEAKANAVEFQELDFWIERVNGAIALPPNS